MFNTRGGFAGQRPMGPPRMNQPGLNPLGMNMSSMNMSGMNMSAMGLSSMSQPSMTLSGMSQPSMTLSGMSQPSMTLSGINLSGMNQPNMNTGMPRMGHPVINPNLGLANVNPSGMNQSGMNVFRMGPSGMNQGGMGFQSEIKNQGFGVRSMDSPGSFLGGNNEPMGMTGLPLRTPERLMGPQGLPQRFPTSSSPMTPAQPRNNMQSQEIPSIVNRRVVHSSNNSRGNPKTSIPEASHLMEKKPLNPLSMFGNLSQNMGIKPGPSSSLAQMPNVQNRYTNESASSILESFGLSNEDLEELSRYPDEQLTPVNLPNILRDIRLRKINRTGGTHDQGGGGGRRSGGDVLPSKVIDYGHSSKFQFNDNSTPSRPFDSRSEQKPSPVSKEPGPSNANKGGKGKNPMDNKIPTISNSRKGAWQTPKNDRFNRNKPLVGEQTTAKASGGSVTVSNAESPANAVKTDSTTLRNVPVISDTAATTFSGKAAESPVGTVISQGNYASPAEANPTAGKGSLAAPPLSQEEAQKMKRMPTPSMMNDYFAASPRIFPHICSLCNLECRHLKDWIKHQNNASHIESCRKLRQQYPDWNPQVHTLNRNEGKQNDAAPKVSRSKSGSPRRAKRSGSRSRVNRSRSRSPRPAKLSRSRSPRRVRRSPRRSPGPRPLRRSPSPRRPRRGRSGTPPDKRAVDAAVQSFIEAERRQDKGGEKPKAAAGDVKKLPPKPANTNVKGKKPFGGGPSANRSGSTPRKNSNSSSSSYSKKPSSVSSVKSNNSSGSASRKPINAPKKPLPSSSGPKKPVVSTGAKKTTGSVASKKPQANKMCNSPKAAEPFNPLNKFTSKSGSDKIIHVTNLPDSGYTDQDILKIVQPFGKVGDILIIRSKNEAFLETNFREAAAAAVKFSETVPVMINGKRLVLSLAGRKRAPQVQVKADTKATGDAESKKPPPQKAAPVPAKEQKDEKTRKEEKETMEKKPETVKHNIEVPPGFVKCHRLVDPLLKEAEKCVVVVSNLPEKQYTVEEISNLAKPFGGVNDILVIPNYRKAYLELTSRNSLDSMLKFYSVFPTCLAGNTLNIAMAPAFKDLKDENRIFAEIIEQASCKITPNIYEKFVHLSNLPEGEIEEFELTRIGLRFGKVEHYIVISNRRKAILHMTSYSAAKSMHAVLSRFPGRIEETVLKCSLVFKAKLPENEYETYLEEKKSSEPDQNICEEVAPNLDEEMQLEEQQQPVSDADIAEADVEAAGVFTNEEVEEVEDDDDYEEAAEAPEAPDAPEAPASFIQPQPVEEQPICSSIAQPYATEESDVLVSVESDEEECEEQCPEIPVIDSVSMEHMLTAEDSEESDSNDMETSTKEMSGDCSKPVEASAVDDQNIFALDDWISVEVSQVPETLPEPTNKESEGSTAVGSLGKEETSSVKAEESSDKEAKPESGRSPRDARSKENGHSNEDKSRQSRERSRQSSHGNNGDEAAGEVAEEPKDSEQAAMATKVPATRTAKFNPQRGELSVTLTVDGQKSSSKTPDPRKKYSGDRGSSGRESSTPKSSSNRSSPSESVSSNPKTATASHQTRSGHRGVGTQDRDSKVPSRSRDVDVRSNRKDDRSKDSPVCFESVGDGIGESNQSTGDTSISQSLIKNSSSGRWVRNSTRKNRGQRSNEEGEEPFPFNLDEFVTVDEIVEDNTDKPKGDEEKSETGATKRGEKRKENHPPSSDTKKPKEASGEAQELSFVTLDEVGDEEDNAATSEGAQDEMAQSLVTVDEVHTEDKVQAVDKVKAGNGPPSRTQESSVLMTLDEVSDDEEPNGPSMPSVSSTILDKDQLLTLDEVSGEDEEQTSHSEPSIHETENKGEKKSVNPKTKENPGVRPQEPDQERHAEQPMLTLDEVVADDDEEEEDSIGDIEHQFLTVDEVGEEEEDSEVKEDVAESKPKSSRTSSRTSLKLSQPESKTPAGRRGRPRKRPLSESAEDAKDTSLQTSVDSSMVSESDKTPSKTKPKMATKGADHGKAGGNPIATPEKPSAGAPKASATPAKKTKLESPSPVKTKLGPFNATMPVGLEFLVPKTGYFCELCSLFYMDEASKLKHCKSLRHYQTVQKHLAEDETTTTKGKSPSL